MKKMISFVIVLLISTMILSACKDEGESKVIPKEQVEDVADTGIRDQSQWQEYVNSRFGYSIHFPKTWYKGNSSQNNDGIVLHVNDTSFDIRVYGANYMEGISEPYRNQEKEGFEKKDIELNQGETVTLITGEEENMWIYEMVAVLDDFEYHFYAKVSKEYAKEYEDVIINVIKTFNPSLEGEEKQPAQSENIEEAIKDEATTVISAISEKDMEKLGKYVHPEKGVRFTPYTYVSVKNDLVFKKNQIENFMEDTNKYLWGYYDGSGFEIKVTPEEYWDEFIYDKDFKTPDEISYNEVIGKSLMKENQFSVYKDAMIVEYYDGGSNPEFEGMDWASLRLVFQKYNNKWYLVGIIHNEHVI